MIYLSYALQILLPTLIISFFVVLFFTPDKERKDYEEAIEEYRTWQRIIGLLILFTALADFLIRNMGN